MIPSFFMGIVLAYICMFVCMSDINVGNLKNKTNRNMTLY